MADHRAADGVQPIRFGRVTLDMRRGRLLRGADDVRLRAKTWAVLCYLAERRGSLVSKDELLRELWPDVVVTEETLSKSITEIRRALGDNPGAPRFLKTVHGRGFCLFGSDAEGAEGPPPEAEDDSGRALPPDRLLVGRADELAQLARCWQEALAGRRQFVFVTGEPGIGKTALVDAFLATAPEHTPRAAVWVGRGHSVEQHGAREPYLPVLDALGHLARQAGAAELPGLLRRWAPTWLANLPWLREERVEGAPPAVEDVRPQRMLREFAALVEAVGAAAPLILALEDLHWSDPATAELLFMLAQRREPARLLVIGTYRPAELSMADHALWSVQQTLRARRQSHEIALAGLDVAGVRDYLAQRCPGAASLELATLIQAHTDGTPLFVAAVIDHLIGRGWLIETDPGWALTAPLNEVDLGVPDDVREIIRTELRSLRPRAQSLLETASVAGIEFDVQAVAAAMRAPTEATEAQCERLARAGRFLRIVGSSTWPDGSIARRYAFRHALHRQVAYDDVPEARRRECHQQLGEALERGYADHVALIASTLAYHFEHGGDHARTLTYLSAAAAGAQQRFAPRQVIAYIESARRLLEQQPDGTERRRRELALRLQIGPSLNAVHGYASDAVRANYDRALTLCDDDTAAAQRYAVLYALWHSRSVRAERPDTRRAAEELVEQAVDLGPAERWLAQSLLGRTALYEGAFSEARALLEPLRTTWPSALDSDAPLFGPAPLVASDGHLGEALWFLGFPDQASAVSRDALARGQQSDSPFTLAAALFHCAYLSHLRSEPAETARFADQLAAVALDQGLAYWDGLAKALSGWALARHDDAAAGVERIQAGLAASRASGARLVNAQMLSFLAEAQGRLGNPEAGLAAADEGLELSQTTLDAMHEPDLWRIKGELLAGSYQPKRRARAARRARPGAIEAAEQCIRRSIDLARVLGSPSLELRAALSLADLLLARGARDEARALVGPVYGRFTEGLDTEDLRKAGALMAGR